MVCLRKTRAGHKEKIVGTEVLAMDAACERSSITAVRSGVGEMTPPRQDESLSSNCVGQTHVRDPVEISRWRIDATKIFRLTNKDAIHGQIDSSAVSCAKTFILRKHIHPIDTDQKVIHLQRDAKIGKHPSFDLGKARNVDIFAGDAADEILKS